MSRTDASQFSNVLAAVQRTSSLPGGPVRGLPHGKNFDGLPGLQSFALELSEAQKELHLGRVRSAVERVKQLEIQFNVIANRWNSSVSALISDVREGKQFKNLEKLKELKAAQVKMQLLVSPARKAFQDLVAALDNDVIARSHEQSDATNDSSRHDQAEESEAFQEPEGMLAGTLHSEETRDWTPDAEDLGSFAFNYRCGTKLQLSQDVNQKFYVVPELERGKFYYLVGLTPPRVIRIREIKSDEIVVFDTIRSNEATLETSELASLIRQGAWILINNG